MAVVFSRAGKPCGSKVGVVVGIGLRENHAEKQKSAARRVGGHHRVAVFATGGTIRAEAAACLCIVSAAGWQLSRVREISRR